MMAELNGNRRVLMFAGGDSKPPTGGLLSLDPTTGKIDFRFPWRSTTYESVNASNPVAIGNQIFISATYGKGGALLEARPDGAYNILWKNQVGAHWNTPIHDNGYLYLFDGRNIPDTTMICMDVKTGQVVWRQSPMWDETIIQNGRSRSIHIGIFRGSLLKVDGAYLCLGEIGHLLWLDLSPQGYREMARAKLFFAQETWSLPVLSRGLLYVNQNSRDMMTDTDARIRCYDLRDK